MKFLFVWFCDQPYGINCIKTTVKDICKEAGIEGNFTNHSSRASCTSRKYDSNVLQQIIKDVMGHRSDCVCVYKRTREYLRQAAGSTVLGEPSEKKVKFENCDDCNELKVKGKG